MATPVFITVDTEIVWRHHAAGCDPTQLYERSFEPADCGVSHQLAALRRHGLKATFFVDPMPALVYGLDPIKRIVATIRDAGQDVQLHLHPNWAGAKRGDGGASFGRFQLSEYTLDEQIALIDGARDLLMAAGADRPVAFRAGNYAANDDTLVALARLGFDYDTSHNGSASPWPSMIALPTTQVAPVRRAGIVELPVTLIEERVGAYRNFQICALSAAEMRAAFDHALAADHGAVTIVSHGFELANRAGTSANAVHVRRFETLCALLADHADLLPTQWFRDRPVVALDRHDAPLPPSALRTRWRQAEQLWSNVISERVA